MFRFLFLHSLLSLFLFFHISVSFSQSLSKSEEKKTIENAEYYFGEEYYGKALELFQKLEKHNPTDVYYKLMVGICMLYNSDLRVEALEKMKEVKKLNPDYNEINYYLGRAYMVNRELEKAISYFNKYKREDIGKEDLDNANRMIDYCNNAKKLMADSLKEITFTPIGTPINTKWSEYVPLISPDESILIFTYRGERSKGGLMDKSGKPDVAGDYYEDVFISTKKNGTWNEPENIGDNINTIGHDAAIALSIDGQKLLIYKSTKKDKGDIYMSNLEGDTWSKPKPLDGDINTTFWEGSASISMDEKTIYFASDRPGGFGKRDLYTATKLPNNKWGNVKNMGPTINTPFNEDAPFIHPDNQTLYFSSEGHNSMGGYDIFYVINEKSSWGKPTNVGYPVNTIDDDRYYVLSADGKTGYYSSARKGGIGGHDIYTVTPGHFGKKPILALVLGTVTANNKVVDADITVTNETKNEEMGQFKSNSATGKYMLALTPGNKYKIAIEVEGYETKVEYLNIESLDTYVQVEHDLSVFSKDFKDKLEVKQDTTLQQRVDQQISKYRELADEKNKDNIINNAINLNEVITGKSGADSLTDKEKYIKDQLTDLENKNIIDKSKTQDAFAQASDKEIGGVSFKVEIGAVTNPNDFKLAHLEKYGKISSKTYPDGITRYSFGPFKTLAEAESFRLMLIEKEKEASDAFVTVFVLGERKTLPEYQQNPCAERQEFVDFSELIGKDLNDIKWYNLLLQKGGGLCAEGLVFEVQIAAYRFPKNYKYDHLISFGAPVIREYPDGITRFTQGKFVTLNEAEELRQKIITAGQKDAWVTPFYNGNRMLMEELIKVNFYGRRIN
ncbi:MAG: hypothetical protein HND27_04285 [Bacteroidetes bacterium]|nr:hypothetical protein [Bacteroidota bacterium]MBV6460301.1 hypothetical protein [Flavobacteriales bacterium]WKZ74669.1 MAG: hypothetical protein QY303_11020 [Vicingaceae bacterium]MCL4815833.1 PD40 domain-containing protein [Flavobacteriales bacterium]NOG94976.1 hypothetical protein [Bacteroidota bacterium]